MEPDLDEVDRNILHLLQEDARNNTNTKIADAVGVAPSTVSKRIRKLEDSGIIQGYTPLIDYDVAGFPLRVLFICSTEILDRGDLIQDVLELHGVVNARELMTGDNNIQIEVVGRTNDDITELAFKVSQLGIKINEEVLVKNEFLKPASVFE